MTSTTSAAAGEFPPLDPGDDGGPSRASSSGPDRHGRPPGGRGGAGRASSRPRGHAHQGSVAHPRDTRVKRTLYVVAGVGAALIFGLPLLWAVLRAFQPNALPVALLNLQTGAYGQVDFGTLVAGSVVAMIPCIALYVALQKFYVAGLSTGAVKG